MKSSLVTLAFFLFGCVAGVSYAVDFDVHQTSVYVLYVLMLLLGINLGSNRNLRQFVLSPQFQDTARTLCHRKRYSVVFRYRRLSLEPLEYLRLHGCRKRILLLFRFLHPYHADQIPLHRCAACYRIGDHRATIQYLPGNDRLDRSSPFPQIFRLSGTYLGGGHRFFRHFPGSHRTLLRTGSRTRGHRPRHTDKHKHAFLRFFLLQTVS